MHDCVGIVCSVKCSRCPYGKGRRAGFAWYLIPDTCPFECLPACLQPLSQRNQKQFLLALTARNQVWVCFGFILAKSVSNADRACASSFSSYSKRQQDSMLNAGLVAEVTEGFYGGPTTGPAAAPGLWHSALLFPFACFFSLCKQRCAGPACASIAQWLLHFP